MRKDQKINARNITKFEKKTGQNVLYRFVSGSVFLFFQFFCVLESEHQLYGDLFDDGKINDEKSFDAGMKVAECLGEFQKVQQLIRECKWIKVWALWTHYALQFKPKTGTKYDKSLFLGSNNL